MNYSFKIRTFALIVTIQKFMVKKMMCLFFSLKALIMLQRVSISTTSHTQTTRTYMYVYICIYIYIYICMYVFHQRILDNFYHIYVTLCEIQAKVSKSNYEITSFNV